MNDLKPTDGGPAFPNVPSDPQYQSWYTGMSLRDYFAGKALAAILTQDPRDSAVLDNPNGRRLDEWLAVNAYAFADAMIAARNS